MMIAPTTSLPSLRDLLAGIVALAPEHDRRVRGLALDSRHVRPGDVFCAIRGTHEDGRAYIEDAVRAGAVAVLTEGVQSANVRPVGIPVIAIPDLRTEIGEIAARYYGEPSAMLKVIGVTGTNGKTTVSHLIARALSHIGAMGPCGVIGTLGIGFPERLRPAVTTTPDPITLQQQLADLRANNARAVSMEVSSHALDQWRVAGTRFAVAVFTNLTRDHLDYHGSMDAYAAAKARLFQTPGLGAAVINADDAYGRELLAALPPALPAYAYTSTGAETPPSATTISASDIVVENSGVSLAVRSDTQHARIGTRLLGRFNAVNLVAAFSAAIALGVQWEEAVAAFQDAEGVPGRMEPLQTGADSPLVVVDYAHTPDGLQQVLQSAREFCRGRLWCVFGCGGNRDAGKRPLMGAIAAQLADVVVITSDNPRNEDPARIAAAILAGMPPSCSAQVNTDRAAAVREAVTRAQAGDVVVVAGKGHEDYQEINGQRLPLSDRALVLAALRERGR